MGFDVGPGVRGALFALPLAIATTAVAAQECRLCARAVVTNSALATCFLQDYDALATDTDPTVIVDLSDCEFSSRSVIAPLPSPHLKDEPPDVQFILTRAQLACLRERLVDPELVLDPSARIPLDDCGAVGE